MILNISDVWGILVERERSRKPDGACLALIDDPINAGARVPPSYSSKPTVSVAISN